jgi:hypothetical protein
MMTIATGENVKPLVVVVVVGVVTSVAVVVVRVAELPVVTSVVVGPAAAELVDADGVDVCGWLVAFASGVLGV